MANDPIVIVGGGRAAASLIDAYREAGGDELITVVSADDQPPYNRPPLSKGVLRGEMEPDDALVHTAEEYDDIAVELRLETTVESVDTGAHTVAIAGGETIPYQTLVIASGARPRMLAVPGADLPAVHTFRTLRRRRGGEGGSGRSAQGCRRRRQLHRIGSRSVAEHDRPGGGDRREGRAARAGARVARALRRGRGALPRERRRALARRGDRGIQRERARS